MSDALYLSLWYPNLRLATLADKLAAVLGEFAKYGGESGVYAATVWPVSWQESPVFQRVWGRLVVPAGEEQPGLAAPLGATPRAAVEETLELLHEDYAYEFQIGWSLWELETAAEHAIQTPTAPSTSALRSDVQDDPVPEATFPQDDAAALTGQGRWARVTRLVRVTGFGPMFDEGAYEQDGHIRIDFGSDAPFLEEEAELNSDAARHMAENVRQLVDLTNAVEKASGATARILWSELGESLAQRLAARLSQGN
jgi:hypothetical protein